MKGRIHTVSYLFSTHLIIAFEKDILYIEQLKTAHILML